MGVPYVWVLDPETKQAYDATPLKVSARSRAVSSTENPTLEVPLNEIFGLANRRRVFCFRLSTWRAKPNRPARFPSARW